MRRGVCWTNRVWLKSRLLGLHCPAPGSGLPSALPPPPLISAASCPGCWGQGDFKRCPWVSHIYCKGNASCFTPSSA